MLGLVVGLDVLDCLLNGRDLLGFLIRDFGLELLLERHHELDGVQLIGAEIVHERRFVLDVRLVDTQLLGNNLLDALLDVFHERYLSSDGAYLCRCLIRLSGGSIERRKPAYSTRNQMPGKSR